MSGGSTMVFCDAGVHSNEVADESLSFYVTELQLYDFTLCILNQVV